MYRLPTSMRHHFQKPFGPIVQTAQLRTLLQPSDLLVCVGDHVSKTALDLGLRPRLIIVDFRTKRGDVDPQLKAFLSGYGKVVIRVRNEPATVSNDLYVAVVQGLRITGPTRIEVEGEEDLAGLPVFAEAPLAAVVLYGMPDQGVVVVRVDDAMRQCAKDLLARMRVKS